MAALSAYENAEPEDILDTERKGAASIRLLLRRASSADYLSDNHRLPLTSSKRAAILKLVAIRNQALHILPEDGAAPLREVPRLMLMAVEAIRHLTLVAPAFDPTKHGVDLALIADYLAAIEGSYEGET